MTTAILALSGPLSLCAALWPLCRYLTARDARETAERLEMLQRIQAPEVAVASHVAGTTLNPTHLPFDDDQAWDSYQDEIRVARG